jgi:hypothetical protein
MPANILVSLDSLIVAMARSTHGARLVLLAAVTFS